MSGLEKRELLDATVLLKWQVHGLGLLNDLTVREALAAKAVRRAERNQMFMRG